MYFWQKEGFSLLGDHEVDRVSRVSFFDQDGGSQLRDYINFADKTVHVLVFSGDTVV